MCHNCNSPLVPYITGYPTDWILEWEREGKVKWSGTCIWESTLPNSWCLECNTGFEDRVDINW